jgi:hypothetical protein
MPIISYDSLASAVINYSTDATDLAGPMDTLVTQGEHLIFHGMGGQGGNMEPLRVRKMEVITEIAPTTPGVVALPADYLQWRRVVEVGGYRRELDPIAPAAADQMYPAPEAGPAGYFSVIGDNLYTYPLTGSPIELTYYAKPLALNSEDGDTAHTFLTAYPMLYLRATLAMAAEWLKDGGEMQANMALLRGAISALNREGQMDALAKTPITFRRQIR